MADVRCVKCQIDIPPGEVYQVGKAHERNTLCHMCFNEYVTVKRGLDAAR